jgi:amino acid adenylation domain-containing protein
MQEGDSKSVRQVIDRMALTQSDAAFLISPETERLLTFAGLQEQSRAVASRLQEAGLQRGDKVALVMGNGLFTVQLFLGTMYAGLVSVPLDVRAGAAQLAATLEHCDAKLIFAEEQYRAVVEAAVAGMDRATLVITADIDSFANEIVMPLDDPPSTAPKGEDPALLMYTSGSVGRPKAAVHSHRTLLAHGRNCVRSHELSSTDRSLLVLPLYHINAECVTLMPTLMSGGSVVVPHCFNVSQFWDWLDDYRCTWSAVVPTIVAQLLDWQDPRAEMRKSSFRRVRFLRSSSAPLSPSLHREFLTKFELLLIQAMGSTETGNIFSNPLPPSENKIGSPGLAWGFETRIIDRNGADLPSGEPGEVLLRGPAIMQGYYKDPDLTATVLDAEGWLHTGDLAYRDPDGYFFVVGRSKEVIIKSGVNIAPRQIDEVLESHPAVLEAAVVGVPDRYVGEDLVAFAVLRAGMQGDEREMLSFCESSLGHFRTPTRIHFVADLPKGPSGKVQRLHLLEQMANLSAVAASNNNHEVAQSKEPRSFSIIEHMVAECWAELLGQTQFDPDSNFFALGGHSLMVIRCLSKLREKLPVALSLSDFFENSTVAQLAALVSRRLNEPSGSVGSPLTRMSSAADDQISQQAVEEVARRRPIPRRARTSPYPLSPGQRRLWFFRELAPELPLYNEAEAVRLRGELDIGAMQQALDAVVARHEVLRTTFDRTEEGVMASVHESWALTIKQIDVSGLAAEQREAEVERLLIDEPRRWYDLEREPGIRVTLLCLGTHEHVFILMMHHVICDRWSMGVVSRELTALYEALVGGRTPSLPALPIQNGDYVIWQLQRAEADFAKELAYWDDNLRGAPELLELPTDRPRPRVQTYRGAKKHYRLDAQLAKGLRERSRQEKASLYTIFAAALNVLLYRYTGSEDLVIGIPVADRDRHEAQSLIGFLVDTHALRTRLSGDTTFRELLARVQTSLVGLYSHREVPFDQVVSRICPDRDLSHSPLLQVMLNWRDRDQQLAFIGLHGLAVEPLLAQTKAAKSDLTLVLTDSGNDIWLEAEYNTDLFDEQRITRMLGHYQTLLEAVAVDPDQCLAALPMLTATERRHLLVDWNRTEVDYPKELCVHQLFEKRVERDSDAVAVVDQDRSLSYGELNTRSNRLAHHLRGLGVGPDTLVAVCMERSLEIVIGLLAILKGGGAYVPLDPSYPADRLAFMVQDSAPAVILSHKSARAALEAAMAGLPQRPPILDLDADAALWSGQPMANPDSAEIGLTPSHLAYVIYTSGSTGIPKGVMTEHRALTNKIFTMIDYLSVVPETRYAVISSISFDPSLEQIFLPLCAGATTVVVPDDLRNDANSFAIYSQRHGITTLNVPPPLASELLFQSDRPRPFAVLLLGGDLLSADLVDRLRNFHVATKICNIYGPTEACIDAAAHHVTEIETPDPTPIGRPLPNYRIYILDAGLEPVPIGVAGEIYIGGTGVARGYLNRPELTAERFIASPFVPGDRLYKTGDLGRYLADGNIEFLGRNDFQVKIRGYRIELGEIEARLLSYPGVREAVVLAQVFASGEKRLAAYIVPFNPQGAAAPRVDELCEFLRQKLPEYMVPAAIVTLEKLPLTSNGKIDRKALPAPDGRSYATPAFEAPRTPTEEALAEIWNRVLGITQPGVHDNFFDLGGHSLLAVRLLFEVNKSFDYNFSVASFFRDPTIDGMARAIQEEKQATSEPQLIPLKPGASAETVIFLQAGIGVSRLARFLKAGTAVFATLVPWQIDLFRESTGGRLADLTVEKLAAPHAALIRSRLRAAHCVLVGYSFGGVLAFEVAHQLQREGIAVEIVLLLDSLVRAQAWWHRFSLRRARRSLRDRASDSWRRIQAAILPLAGVPEVRSSLSPEFQKIRFLSGEVPKRTLLVYRKVSRKCQHHPLDCQGVLFQCRTHGDPRYAEHARAAWKRLFIRGLQIEEIPGDHMSFLKEPIVKILAKRIDDVLERLRAQKAYELEQGSGAGRRERVA